MSNYKYQIGDTIRYKCEDHDGNVDFIGTIKSFNTLYSIKNVPYYLIIKEIFSTGIRTKKIGDGWFCNQEKGTFELIKSVSGEQNIITPQVNQTNKMTGLLQKIKSIRTPEPEKTLIKAGILNENQELTSEGKDVLLDILYQDNKDKLKEVADEFIAEKEKEDKK